MSLAKIKYYCFIFIFAEMLFDSLTFVKSTKPEMYYDYCNVNESKVAYLIIRDILEYYALKQTDHKCFITNPNLSNYYLRFENIEKENKNAYGNFKCTDCHKKFKSKAFLYLHYKLFHLAKLKNYNTKYYCPSYLCKIINCDRYKLFFSVPFSETHQGNKIVVEKKEECNKNLVNYYRTSCIKLLQNCFDPDKEESSNLLFEFYNNFCMKINCERKGEYDYKLDLQKEGSAWDVLHVVFVYIVSILTFIYMLIVWISKYS